MNRKENERKVEENFYFRVRDEVVGQIGTIVSQEMIELFGKVDFDIYSRLFLDKVYEGVVFENEFSMKSRINGDFEELIEALLLDLSTVGGEFENKVRVETFIKNSKINEPFIPDASFRGDAVRYYLIEATNHRLLTGDEEVMLARKIQRGIAAKKLNVKTEVLNDIITEAGVAREDLINHNQRLVVNFVRGRVRSDGDIGDLIQEGNLGLLRAADKFDPERGLKFSTYATWWIKQFIARGSVRDGSQMWIPAHVRDRMSLVKKAEAKLVQNGGITFDKVVEMTGLLPTQVEEVYEVRSKMSNLIELDRPVSIDGDVSFGELQEDRSLDQNSRAGEIRAALLSATETLNPRHAHMIRLRFGLLEDGLMDEMTFDEIGKLYGISKQRVSQIVEFGIKVMAKDKKIRIMLEEYLSEA